MRLPVQVGLTVATLLALWTVYPSWADTGAAQTVETTTAFASYLLILTGIVLMFIPKPAVRAWSPAAMIAGLGAVAAEMLTQPIEAGDNVAWAQSMVLVAVVMALAFTLTPLLPERIEAST